ncbi:MAG: hypothetical protein ABII25_06415 [bacterium]
MSIKCLFCNNDVRKESGDGLPNSLTSYFCNCCGSIHIDKDAVDDYGGEKFSEKNKNAISITLRNEWETRGRKSMKRELTLDDFRKIVSQFKPLNPIEKMDHALITFDKRSNYVGSIIDIKINTNYPIYYCSGPGELKAICNLLLKEGFIFGPDQMNPQNNCFITVKGYQRIKEIQKPNKNSRQCFVAMWFSPEMQKVYDNAIKPAIEFIEKG